LTVRAVNHLTRGTLRSRRLGTVRTLRETNGGESEIVPVAAPFAPFATSRADSSARDGVADVAGRRVHAPIRFLAILLPLSEPAGRERGNAFKLRTERKRRDASLLLPLPYEGRYESTFVRD
jgi:hypothetical protein